MESITQLKKIIKTARNNNIKSIVCEFTTIEKVALHPQEGIPLLYHDQLNIVAKHLEDIKLSEDEQNTWWGFSFESGQQECSTSKEQHIAYSKIRFRSANSRKREEDMENSARREEHQIDYTDIKIGTVYV